MYVLNSQIRGGGHVGELTQNISRAFAEAERCHERELIPVMVFIDEADSLAQARGGKRTHHEDDAGVNTLLQRIDKLRGKPIATILATNTLASLDHAILRRTLAIYRFERPTAAQRLEVFKCFLKPMGIDGDLRKLVSRTDPAPRSLLMEKADMGTQVYDETPAPEEYVYSIRYTYSDLTQRIIPQAIETAIVAEKKLTLEHLSDVCNDVQPTPELSPLPDGELDMYFDNYLNNHAYHNET
jgi:SpoVK/Ycf46/Vps4 family AAA+-type ATPase